MATIGLKVKLEDTALGPVMILLRKTPGVIGWEIEMDTLAPPAPKLPGHKKLLDVALEQFGLGEPVTIDQMAIALGAKTRAHGAVTQLRGKKLVHAIAPRGTWALTARGRAVLGLPPQKLLAPPAKKAAKATPAKAVKAKPAKAKSNGHAAPAPKRKSPGAGAADLAEVLKAHGALSRKEIAKALDITDKAVGGLLHRGKLKGTIAALPDHRYNLATSEA